MQTTGLLTVCPGFYGEDQGTNCVKFSDGFGGMLGGLSPECHSYSAAATQIRGRQKDGKETRSNFFSRMAEHPGAAPGVQRHRYILVKFFDAYPAT